MSKILSKPAYHYANEGSAQQLGRLLREFLAHNQCRPVALAEALGCKPKMLDQWIAQGPETSLLSRYMAMFEQVTGISLDRLMVIDAKRAILNKLLNLDAVRRKMPDLAFLLARDPDLASKIDFDRHPTRQDIVLEVQVVADRCGSPTVARELMLNDRYVSRWWATTHNNLPANDALERAIILTTIGFICMTAQGRDDARFRVVAYHVLGIPLKEALGITSLGEALSEVFRGMEGDPDSVVENRTGLIASTVKRLREWKSNEDTGKMTTEMQGKLLRILMERKHQAQLERFDAALTAFLEGRGWAKDPVFLGRTPSATAPTRIAPEVTVPAPRRTEPTTIALPTEPIPILHQVEFEKSLAAVRFLLKVYPTLLGELRITVAEPSQNDWFIQMANGTGLLSATQMQHLLMLFQFLPKILERLLLAPLQDRERFLRLIDPGLVQMQGLLDAAQSTEPAEYRRQFLHPQRELGSHKPS